MKATAAEGAAELTKIKEENERLKREAGSAKTKTEPPQKEPTEPPRQEPSGTGAEPAATDDLRSQNESLTREVASLKQRIQELEEQQGSQPEGRQPQNRCCGLL